MPHALNIQIFAGIYLYLLQIQIKWINKWLEGLGYLIAELINYHYGPSHLLQFELHFYNVLILLYIAMKLVHKLHTQKSLSEKEWIQGYKQSIQANQNLKLVLANDNSLETLAKT